MKKIIILLALCLIPLSVFNQEIEPTEYGKNEFGAHVGSTTGLGLSYRHWFAKTGFQLTAVPIISDDFYFVSAGLTFLQYRFSMGISVQYRYRSGFCIWKNRSI